MLKIVSRFMRLNSVSKVKSSELLCLYLSLHNYPPWTAFFILQSDIIDDHFPLSHYNFIVENEKKNNGVNYHVLRTRCYPYVKFHCSKRPYQDLSVENYLFTALKVVNFGFPCLLYGIAGRLWAKHIEKIAVEKTGQIVELKFWYAEDKGNPY